MPEPPDREKKILLSLDPSTHLVMQALAVDEGVSVTRLTERFVMEAVRRRVNDGHSEEFMKRLQKASRDVANKQP